MGRAHKRSPKQRPRLRAGCARRDADLVPILFLDRAVRTPLCVSVYPALECPAFRDAVLLAAVRDMTGQRRVVSVHETGAFPEPVVAQVQHELRAFGPGLEFHLHLLAASPAERAATLADLAIAQA